MSIKSFKIKFFFRRKATPSIDSSGAKPPNFSQNQRQSQRQKILNLILIELVYLGEAKMRGSAPHLSMKPKASSKKEFEFEFDFKEFDFKAFWFSPAFIYEAEGFVLKRISGESFAKLEA